MRMKISAFRVEQKGPRALEDLLDRLNRIPLERRSFEGSNLRLETSRMIDGLMCADFAGTRSGHGPGRMSRNAPLEGIAMEEGFTFGEDTGIVYNPETGNIAVQYNHTGPRMAGIEKYLRIADCSFGGIRALNKGETLDDVAGYSIGVALKPDAYARLRRWGIYKSVEVTVSVPGVAQADLEAGRSLASVLRTPFAAGVEKISMTISAKPGRDGALGEDGVRGIIGEIEQFGVAVKRAVIRGKATAEDPMDAVNLVSDAVSSEVKVELGHGLRLVREDRWDALRQKLREWEENRLLPRVTG